MNPEQMEEIARYVGALGILFYLALHAIVLFGKAPDAAVMKTCKLICWLMIVSPIAMQWYFSKYLILYMSTSLVAVGVGIKLTNKFKR